MGRLLFDHRAITQKARVAPPRRRLRARSSHRESGNLKLETGDRRAQRGKVGESAGADGGSRAERTVTKWNRAQARWAQANSL
jgi:hypothetical protein